MDVILLEEVTGLGPRGTTVKVSPGYARNYLLPRRLAIVATGDHGSLFRTLAKQRETRDARLREEAESFAARLTGTRVTLAERVAEEGNLYGSVHVEDIQGALARLGFEVDKRNIHLDEHIKQVGEYQVPVRLFGGVTATVTVEVVAS